MFYCLLKGQALPWEACDGVNYKSQRVECDQPSPSGNELSLSLSHSLKVNCLNK